MRNKREKWEGKRRRQDLSRDDLLFLLSVLEGELQVGMIPSHSVYIFTLYLNSAHKNPCHKLLPQLSKDTRVKPGILLPCLSR